MLILTRGNSLGTLLRNVLGVQKAIVAANVVQFVGALGVDTALSRGVPRGAAAKEAQSEPRGCS